MPKPIESTRVYRTDAADAATPTVARYDRAALKSFVKTDEGYLLVEGYASRPGILQYIQPDGTARRELVPADELAKTDSLATLARKPVTLDHPDGFVTPENVADHQVGDVSESIEIEEMNGFVKIRMAVRKADAIEAINNGVRELSVGYTTEIEETSGVDPVFGRYDAIQRNRRYNHVAIVPRGRAGSEVGLRADSADEIAELRAEIAAVRQMVVEAAKAPEPDAEPADEPVEIDQGATPTEEAPKADAEDRMSWFAARVDAMEVAKLAGAEHAATADVGDIQRAVVRKFYGDVERNDEAYIAAAYALAKKSIREDRHKKTYTVVDAQPAAPVESAEDIYRRKLKETFNRG